MSNAPVRTPPYDREAEWAVVASIAMDGDVLDDVLSVICEDDFFDSHARACFIECVKFRTAGKRFDALLLLNKVRKSNPSIGKDDLKLDELKNSLQSVPSSSHAEHYARIVLDCSIRRSIINGHTTTINDMYDQSVEAIDAVNRSGALITKMQEHGSRTKASSLSTIMQDVLVQLAERREKKQSIGLPTGFVDIDEITAGLPSELVILAARPSVGKTSLALQIAYNIARADKPTLVFSLEMTQLELAERLLSWRSGVSLHEMRGQSIKPDSTRSIIESANELSQVNLTIVDDTRITIADIRSQAARAKRSSGLSLIVIDYLELISPMRREINREREVAEISSGLKNLQKELGVSVLCLAQLNRKVEEGAERDPKLSDLRSSGTIEADAHQVWFLARKIEAKSPGEDRIAKLIVAKNRNGRTGSTKLGFMPETSSFNLLAKSSQGEFL